MKKCISVFYISISLALLTACESDNPAALPQPPATDYSSWSTYGGTPDQIKYSSLRQINKSNVANLEVAWTFDPEDIDDKTVFQTTPLMVDNVLYVASPKFRIYALNPETGKELWKFDPYEDAVDGEEPLGSSRLRGLSYWSDGTRSQIFAVVRNWLYALDAKTGKRIPLFGENGRIDLRRGLDRDPETISMAASTPGMVFEDLLIMGSTVPEVLPSAPGDIRAYDVHTGEIRWTFHTIPRPGEFGYDTWPENAWEINGGANAWSGFSLDTKNELLFFGTGSAAYDFYGANRTGDNLFANSIIALDVRTGKRKWHYQIVKHDIWDRDLPTPPTLITVERDGKQIEALAQNTKSGHIFVLNRLTGEPLFPVEEIATPQVALPGEVLSPTQRLPTYPAPLTRQGVTRDMITTRTPEAHEQALVMFDNMDGGAVFNPPSLNGTLIFPGFDGGAEWGGGTFDPETGLYYVNVNEMPWILQMAKSNDPKNAKNAHDLYIQHCASCHGPNRKGSPPSFPALTNLAERMDESRLVNTIKSGAGRMPAFAAVLNEQTISLLSAYLITGENKPLPEGLLSRSSNEYFVPYVLNGYKRFLDTDGYPAITPPWGTLSAIDISSGNLVWKKTLGEYPELVKQGIKNTGSENYGGSIVTAGGLLFIAATKFDSKIRAFDKLDGTLLWQHDLPAPGTATPAMYEAGGRQFLVIAAGAAGFTGKGAGSYVAFALPQ